jgi:hypothetical protein
MAKSECLVLKYHLKLYSFSMLTPCWHRACQGNFNLKTILLYVLLLTSETSFCFCQACIYFGTKWFHIKHMPLIITMVQLSTVKGDTSAFHELFRIKFTKIVFTQTEDTGNCTEHRTAWFKIASSVNCDSCIVPSAGDTNRNTSMQDTMNNGGGSSYLKRW